MKYETVIIRTKEQLAVMAKNNSELRQAITDFCKDCREWEEFPIVYQFSKGMPGETVATNDDISVGTASNIRIDSDGNFVCDVAIMDVKRYAGHFQHEIDNFVIAKDITKNKENVIINTKYRIVQFVIYDKMTKSEMRRKQKGAGMVQKTYVAPVEESVSPLVGDRLSTIKNQADRAFEDVVKNSVTNFVAKNINNSKEGIFSVKLDQNAVKDFYNKRGGK